MDVNEKCPWCGSVISREKFIQIESQIREQERQKLRGAEASMRKQFEAQFSQNLEAEKKAAALRYQEEVSRLTAQTAAERDKVLAQLSQTQAREAEARKQAQEAKESTDALKKNLEQQLEAERQTARQRGKEEAQKEFAAVEAEHKKFREQFRQLQASEAEARKQVRQATDSKVALERSFNQRLEAEKLTAEKRARQETEALLKKEMESQRAIFEREHDADLAKQKSDFQKQNEAALKEVQELKRKLEEQKTANQLGDGAEVDLFDTLRQHFPGDKIVRVPKGQAGPDIRHWVLYKGETCGQIVYDSKNQLKYMTQWATKLDQDKIDAGADHAILATTVFPAGKKEIYIDDSGVILVNPARAVHIAHLLRAAMIEMHKKGLGQRERTGKTNRLYGFIISNEYKQHFDQVLKLTDELLDLDVEEKKAHDKVWKERGQRLRKQQHALSEIDTKVAAIVEAPDAGQWSAA